MRIIILTFLLFFLSLVSVSAQTEEVIINKAIQTARENNIETKEQAVQALGELGLTESEARNLARSRGISYDSLLNEYFSSKSVKDDDAIIIDPDTSVLAEIIKSKDDIDSDDKDSETDIIDFIFKDSIDNYYFGYEIFKNNPYLEKEYLLGNIDDGYIIAPGDEIRIITYGNNSFEQNIIVDRNGNVNIKGYGLFFVAGNTFKTLKARLKIFLGKYLSGLVSNPQKTFMDVSLVQLKPTKVVVLGQVESPGPQILNTSGSVLSALYAAGGIKYSGTLREIIVYRNNKILKTIDLYDYIITGNLDDDIRLTNNDIVFVSNRKNTIEITGEVKRSAFFETLEDEDLQKLVEFSGGLLPTTQTNKVNIQRIIPATDRLSTNIFDRELITVNYQKSITNNKKIDIKDGDQIIFFRILDLELNQVTVDGHIYEPGTYSLSAYPTLKSLLFDAAKGFMPDTYLEKVDVYSLVDGYEVLNSFSLIEILNDQLDFKLNDGDRVVIYSNDEIEGEKFISISGFGVRENIIKWKENYSLYDFIFSSSEIRNPEFTTNLLETRIDLKRYNLNTGNYGTLKFDFIDLENLRNVFLMPRDKVVLYSNDVTENVDKNVSIFGYVKKGGLFQLEENMYPEDLILLAGGFEIGAEQNNVIVNRLEFDNQEDRVVRKYNLELDLDYLKGVSIEPSNKFTLKENDILMIKKNPGYESPVRVKISGEVNYEQNLILEFKNSTFSDIIKFSGGLTKYANLDASTLTRDGEIMTIDFSKLKNNEQIFMDGDEIFIASNIGDVLTRGAVENESKFIWKKGLNAKKYIKDSGGKLNKVSGKSYIIYPNGKTKKISLFKNPKVLPNSIIFTNRKEFKERTEGKFFTDFNTTFGIISSAITTILLVNRL